MPRRGSLPDDVAAHVRAQILSGAVKPGQKIDQEAIAEQLDVSRSPIREAIVVLGEEGLLDVTPRRGAFVAQLTPGDVIDHYELFGLVSGRVAAMAAETLTEEERAELRRVHEIFAAAPVQEHTELNDEFHRLINRAAPRRTRWLLRKLQRSIPAGFYAQTPGWKEAAVNDHAAIASAIIEGRVDDARLAMEQHLHAAGQAAVDTLQATGFWETE